MSETNDTLTRIRSHRSVQGIVVVNNEGKMVNTFYAQEKKEECDSIIKSVPQLCQKARSVVRDLDPTNDLTFFRIKSKTNNEILVAPDKDFMLIVVQAIGKGDKKDDDN